MRLLGFFNLQTFWEKGELHDRLGEGASRSIQREEFYLNFIPVKNVTCNLYLTMGDSRFTDSPANNKNAGFGIAWSIADSLQWGFNYDRINFLSAGLEEQNKFTTQMSYTLANKHVLSFSGYWSLFKTTKQSETSLLCTYTIPWDMPVYRKAYYGVLKGRVLDSDNNNRPLANVVILVDDATAVTNARGEFAFVSLDKGAHSLWVHKPSIGLHRLPLQEMPITVNIKTNKTTIMDIGVTTAARLYGKIIAFDFKPETIAASDQTKKDNDLSSTAKTVAATEPAKRELVEKGGLGNVLVEISNGKEFLQQKSDSKGRFVFESIWPGSWHVVVNEPDLFPQYRATEKEFDIEVSPGKELEVVFKAVPRISQIKIIEQGSIELENKKKKKRFWFF